MGKATKKSTEHPGLKIQRLRKKLGLDRLELANQTGLNDETLERIEQGKEIPSVGAILQISRVLGMDASGLLTETEKKSLRKSKKESYDKRSRSYAYKTLSSGAAAMHLKAFQVTIEPLQDHEMVEYRHEGEEFIFVLEGEVDVTVGENKHHLKTGKSLHFNSSSPHMLRNPGAEKTTLVVVLYTP